MSKEEIAAFLESKKGIVDAVIEKYIPRKFTKKYLSWAFGDPSYEYDIKTLENALSKPVWDFLDRGGKRWRPALFLLMAEALGADPKKMEDFTALLELSHNGSIMVDDVEDDGDIRRGKECTHKIFGIDVAINAGNFMYFLPYIVFSKNIDKFDKDTMLKAYNVFSTELLNVHLGQGMDIWWHKGKADNIGEKEYLQMCAYKTGTLARMAARLAVVLSGGTEKQEKKLGKVAESIGIGFQIRDDILDIVSSGSDRKKFGKAYGNDIKEGKRTLMVIYTLQKANKTDRERLLEILNLHTKDPLQVDEAISILEKYKSVEYAKSVADRIIRQAWEDAASLIKESKAKKTLKAFVNFLIERDF